MNSGRAVGGMDVVRDLRAVDRSSTRSSRMPGSTARRFVERLPEHRLVLELLGAGVERARADRRVLRPRGDESPACGLEPSGRRLGLGGVEHDRDAVRWARRCTTGAGRSSPSRSTRSTPTSSEPTLATTNRPHMRCEPTRGPPTRLQSVEDADLVESLEQARAVRVGHPRHVAAAEWSSTAVRPPASTASAGERRRIATAATLLGGLARERRVDLVVVLSVVADQQPLAPAGTPRARRRRFDSLCALPLRNQRSCVGPQSVSSSEPGGKRCRRRNRMSVGRDVPRARGQVDDRACPGASRTSRSMSTAMPGTGWRACSSTTNEFHAARSGRGSAVTMTVSSTSETTPKRTSEPDDEHARLDRLAALDRHRERLPAGLEPRAGARCRSRRRGRRRPRASTPSIVTVTCA